MKLAACAFAALTVACIAQPRMPPKKLLEEAQEVLVACRLADKAPEECRRQFGNSTAMPPPDKVKEHRFI